MQSGCMRGQVRDEAGHRGDRLHHRVEPDILLLKLEELTHKIFAWWNLVRQVDRRGKQSATQQAIVTEAL